MLFGYWKKLPEKGLQLKKNGVHQFIQINTYLYIHKYIPYAITKKNTTNNWVLLPSADVRVCTGNERVVGLGLYRRGVTDALVLGRPFGLGTRVAKLSLVGAGTSLIVLEVRALGLVSLSSLLLL